MSAEPAPRALPIDRFLAAHGWGGAERRPLPVDASFRRYIRLARPGGTTLLMDAPPDKEDVRPFIAIATHLRGLGLSAPRVLAADAGAGLALIEDFGDATYTRLLATGADERALYLLAVDVLAALHRHPLAAAIELPPYDEERLLAEAALFVDWYLPGLRRRATPASERAAFLDAWRDALAPALRATPTLVLRDYHVDNLILVPGREGTAACGLLDFQDALIGPAAYDLASLVEDARRDVPEALRAACVARYLEAVPELDRERFATELTLLAAQRHAKVIGIFTRLAHRDGKPRYLQHLPRLWRLLERAVEHPALAPVRTWLARHVPTDERGVPPPEAP